LRISCHSTEGYTKEEKEREEFLTASTAAYLDVPDEVVALLGAELVPEGEGALLAVVLEPLPAAPAAAPRPTSPPPAPAPALPPPSPSSPSPQPQQQTPPTQRERERERERAQDLRLGSDDVGRVRSDLEQPINLDKGGLTD